MKQMLILISLFISIAVYGQEKMKSDYCTILEMYLNDPIVLEDFGIQTRSQSDIIVLNTDLQFKDCDNLIIEGRKVKFVDGPKWAAFAGGRPEIEIEMTYEERKELLEEVKDYIVIKVELLKKRYRVIGYERSYNSGVDIQYSRSKGGKYKAVKYNRGSY